MCHFIWCHFVPRKVMNNYSLLTFSRPVMLSVKLDLSYSRQRVIIPITIPVSFLLCLFNEVIGTALGTQYMDLSCDIYNKILWLVLNFFPNNT